jgi:hypothetical protein
VIDYLQLRDEKLNVLESFFVEYLRSRERFMVVHWRNVVASVKDYPTRDHQYRFWYDFTKFEFRFGELKMV